VALETSYVLFRENDRSPFAGRRLEVARMFRLSRVHVRGTREIARAARELTEQHGLTSRDALHVACAIKARAQVFITVDDRLLRRLRSMRDAGVPLPEPLLPTQFVTLYTQN
jgi:predicted nucleic acid-binding protein